MKNISYEEAKIMMKEKDMIIIDVRTEDEYKNFHIIKSINIPVNKIKNEMKKITNNTTQKIIIYCSEGIRSTAASIMLEEIGYKNIYNIYNGVKRHIAVSFFKVLFLIKSSW